MNHLMNHPFQQTEQSESKDNPTTRTLSRGLAVFSEILRADSPPTLTELATSTGLAKATVSRLLATLVDSGFASQQPGRQVYLPGPSIAGWLRASPLESLLVEQAAPLLDKLRDLSGETAVLCVPAWPDRICIARSLAHSPIRSQKDVGESGALTGGCTGRAFLAFAQESFVDAALRERPLVQNTPSSVTGTKEFFALLHSERENGYSVSFEGTHPHMNGIAVPIFASHSSMPVAVINISGPSSRWTNKSVESFAPTFLEHADRLSNYFKLETIS